ncbi:Uncharacterised protein [Klebsiella pneumoniae]|nr:hypothetical protein AZZ86_004738 [Klebsiella pneumoniae]SXL10066.1 Uncharacterised protein [Klebsiella pneumoniae]
MVRQKCSGIRRSYLKQLPTIYTVIPDHNAVGSNSSITDKNCGCAN